MLVLSNPASTDITVVVEDISYNASGKLYVKYYKHTLDQRENAYTTYKNGTVQSFV